MDIPQIIAAAHTTSNPWIGEVVHGTQRAILTFAKLETAKSVAMCLTEAGATTNIGGSAYGEYILTARWTV